MATLLSGLSAVPTTTHILLGLGRALSQLQAASSLLLGPHPQRFGSLQGYAATAQAAQSKADSAIGKQSPSALPVPIGSVKVILRENIKGLGERGQVVAVPAGRMRHKLFPAGLAAYATPDTLKLYAVSDSERSSKVETEEEQKKHLHKLLKALGRKPVTITRRASPDDPEQLVEGRAVTPQHVLEAVATQLRIQLNPSHLLFTDPIDAFGTFKVPLNLRNAEDQQVELTLHVDRKGGAVMSVAGTASEPASGAAAPARPTA